MTLIISPQQLREARLRAGLTPADAAREAGIGKRTLLAYEAGDITPGGDRLGRMATTYGCQRGVNEFFVHDQEARTPLTGCGTDPAPDANRVAATSGADHEGA